MVGTFIAPTASTIVSAQLLKVIKCTMSRFQQFNWAKYIMHVLWKEMAVYVNSLKKSKGRRSNMGGCIYLLLVYIYCLCLWVFLFIENVTAYVVGVAVIFRSAFCIAESKTT